MTVKSTMTTRIKKTTTIEGRLRMVKPSDDAELPLDDFVEVVAAVVVVKFSRPVDLIHIALIGQSNTYMHESDSVSKLKLVLWKSRPGSQ
jgi:hypothetical protein